MIFLLDDLPALLNESILNRGYERNSCVTKNLGIVFNSQP